MTTESKENKALTIISVENTLKELNVIDKGIADLKQKWGGLKADATTTAGMEMLKTGRAEVREVRYKVPKAVKAATDQLNSVKKQLQSRGEEIETALREIEDPIQEQIKTEEDRKAAIAEEKAQKERDRIQMIQEKIRQIQGAPAEAVGYDSATIQVGITNLESISIGDEFGEFLEAAKAAKEASLTRIRGIYVAKKIEEEEAEKLRLEREAFEKQKADEAKEKERVDAIQAKLDTIASWPRGCIGLSIAHLSECLEAFQKEDLISLDLQEFHAAAAKLKSESLAEIRKMIATQKEQEDAAAKLKADQDKLQKERESFQIEQDRIAKENEERIEREESERREVEEKERLEREEREAELRSEREEKEAAERAIREEEERKQREIREAEEQRLAEERAEIERQKETELRRHRMETLSAIIEIGEDTSLKPADKLKQIIILAKREHSKLSGV